MEPAVDATAKVIAYVDGRLEQRQLIVERRIVREIRIVSQIFNARSTNTLPDLIPDGAGALAQTA